MIDEEARILKSASAEVERNLFSTNLSNRDTNTTLTTRYPSRKERPLTKEININQSQDVKSPVTEANYA